MKPEPFSTEPEVVLTADELIEIRATLFNCQRAFWSLIQVDPRNEMVYKRDLQRIEDTKKLISNSINRELV